MQKSVVTKALSLVNNGYIYGASGQICSPSFRTGQAKQYPEWYNNIMVVGAKWDGVPVWDCAQFTRAVAKISGVNLPSGATSQWTKTDWLQSGTIDTIPPGETVFVYRYRDGKMQHTGLAHGDGWCTHARGTAYGVVLQTMAQHAWTHWAMPRWKEKESMSDDILYTATVTATTGSTVNLRKEPGGDLIDRVLVGTRVAVIAEAGAGWAKITVGNRSGYMQTGFLRKDDPQSVFQPSATPSNPEYGQKVIELLEGIYGLLKGDGKG